jgi:hypothetical protein
VDLAPTPPAKSPKTTTKKRRSGQCTDERVGQHSVEEDEDYGETTQIQIPLENQFSLTHLKEFCRDIPESFEDYELVCSAL